MHLMASYFCSMENLTISKVTLADVDQLKRIGCTTFSETFSDTNTEEDMLQYLESSFSTTKLTKEINNALSQFYFAMIGGEAVGYLKLNTGDAQTERNDIEALEIERIYVLKSYHGKKVGQKLYEKAIEAAHEISSRYIWLGVWEKNQRAIGFYAKNGFVPFDKHIFRLGNDEQIDIMMKKAL